MSDDALLLPRGYGFRSLRPGELSTRGQGLTALLDLCTIWEPPRRRANPGYVIGVDVADGLGQDRSVIEVLRRGTLDEPSEQVAEYVSDAVAPMQLAYIIQALGQYFVDADRYEALVAIERNNHGLSTLDTLQLHLGYTHQYIWEYFDARDPSKRFSTTFGWTTTNRTRPIMLDKLHTALTTLDPITGQPDLLTHSPLLHQELQDFQTEGALWEAAAARGAHDDCVMATAIAYVVLWRGQAGESEPLDDRRRRRREQLARQTAAAALPTPLQWNNTAATAWEMDHFGIGEDPFGETDLDDRLHDTRPGPEFDA